MKYYRLTDAWWEPYHTGYNDTDLKSLAYSIFSLWDWEWAWDDEEFYWKTEEDAVNKIYSLLEAWERDLYYFVEEADEPFEAEWEYWADCRIENWKDYLFDDLNNILFSKHSELTEYIKKWLIRHKLVDDDRIVGELASDFIDQKELYDLDYED